MSKPKNMTPEEEEAWRERRRETARKRRLADPEKYREIGRKQYASYGHATRRKRYLRERDSVLEAKRKFRESNLELSREIGREKARMWRMSNPESAREANRKAKRSLSAREFNIQSTMIVPLVVALVKETN